MDGFIDHLRRPLVRIEGPQSDSESLLCLIDTGYNGFLLLEQSQALRCKFRALNGFSDQITLGDGSIRRAQIARGIMHWFGSNLPIDAHVVPDAGRARHGSPDSQIDALIGTRLLDGLHVLLDFQRNVVTIRQPAE